MSKFEIGDLVKFVDSITQKGIDNIGIKFSHKDDVFQVLAIDPIVWEAYQCGGIITECGYSIPDVLLVKVASPQQKLDQLKKYFESVDQATIKSKDFWEIYNA